MRCQHPPQAGLAGTAQADQGDALATARLLESPAQQVPGLDQFPTVDESGVPGFEMWAWTALYAPAGTPKPIIDKLNALVRQAAKSPAYLNLLKTSYGISFVGSPEELAAFQSVETKKWAEIVSTAGMKEP